MKFVRMISQDRYISAFIGLSVFIFAIQGEGFWRWDDPQIVYFSLTYNPLDYFFDPDIYRQFSGSNFTPWVILSFAIDQLMALDPFWYYLHQSLALAVLAVLYYYVARIWLTPNFALYATVLFAAGLGFFICTIQLMTRHYVEGMIFCLGAIITYNHGVKRQSLLWMLISANFYFFAMLAKEFYAPLPLFLFFMHSQLFGKRILFLFAHAIVALAYILWRFYMLGVPQDIYGTSFNSMSLTSLYSLADVPLLLYGVVGTLIISALVLYLVWRSYLNQSFQGVFLVVALGICILLPLVPLAISVGFEFHLRYLLVPHAAIAILVSFALLHLARSHGTGWAAGLALLLFFFTALSAIQGSERNIASARAFDVQSRFLWEQDASSAILPSFEYALGYYHYAFLTDIKKEKFFVSTPPVLIHPAFAPSYSNLQFKKYSPACECMTDVSASLFRGQKKLGGNLQSTLVREANIFRWSIGAAELTNTGLTTTASRLPFAGAGQGSSGYKLCAILLNNGVTTGMLFTKCGGEFNTSHLIRGAELLKSEILFKATTNNGEDLYSEIYRNPEVKND